MGRHKICDASGFLLTSYIDGEICHEILPICVQKTRLRKKADVSLCVEVPNSSWKRSKIRKIVLGDPNTPITQIAEELLKFHNERGRHLVAACMQLNRESRHDVWTNPLMSETLARMEEARTRASQVNGNKSARRFWEKTLRLHEVDIGLSFDTIQKEIENFRHPFEFS